MSKLTKKQQKVQELLEGFEQPSTGLDALKKLKEVSEAVSKFNETVECHMRLGIEVKHADQQIRSTTVLPAGLGKTVRVCVIAKGAKVNDGSVVGFGSIVNKKFEEKNILIAGAPAKKMKENIDWAIETPEEYLKKFY